MSDVITESGMDFIADNVYRIEKSEVYSNLGEGVKTVEFVRASGDNLLFVEARTTFPNPNNPDIGNSERFVTELRDISEKFIHSLNVFSAIKIGVLHDRAEYMILPENVSLVFVLVIKSHKLEWCKPIEKELVAFLPRYIKRIWKPAVYVLNHDTAVKRDIAIG